jgi:hypothetical protein
LAARAREDLRSPVTSPVPHAAPCATCGSPLAVDQRYCLSCGDRVGPLPEAIAARLAPPRAQSAVTADDLPAGFSMPSPRALAACVLGLLAWGVVVGSAVSPPALSATAAPPVIVAQLPAPAPATTPTTATTDAPTTPADDGSDTAPAAAAGDSSDTSADTGANNGNTDTTDTTEKSEPPPTTPTLPAVKHLWIVLLSGHTQDQTFGADSAAPYLAKTLAPKGELVPSYYGVTQGSLANTIALISGQGPTPQTAAGCATYTEIVPGTIAKDGQVAGDGCVYPAATPTLANQLVNNGQTWKSYNEDVDHGPAGEATSCRHPAAGAADPEALPRPGDAYVTWRNPFAYFHALTDTTACADGSVGLGQLTTDLATAASTPTVSFIVPNRCHDGSDDPCAEGQPAGLAAADAWLQATVPAIMSSPAYKDGGLIAITSDQAPAAVDQSACCDAQTFPNLPVTPTTPTTTPPTATDPAATTTALTTTAPTTTIPGVLPGEPVGGGKVGLLLLSSFVKPGSINRIGTYNHYSLLRSIEDLFGLDHLGYADDPALPAFDKVVYNAATPSSSS